jgi:hypothetical protein
LTAVRDGYRDTGIEWRTYTPDGRVLTVRREETRWIAACEGAEAEDERLVEAIRDAVGGDRGETMLRGFHSREALEHWIQETATHIVGDTLH